MTRGVLRFLIFTVMTFGLAGCGEDYSWNQKLTIEVETPEGLKTAFSIVEITDTQFAGWWVPPEARRVTSKIRGEATVVDLGRGQFLFALLSDGNYKARATHIAQKVFSRDIDLKTKLYPSWLDSVQVLIKLRGPRLVSPEHYPMLVTFSNINDPSSVKIIDHKNLNVVFGKGYRLKSIMLEITDEPVTKGQVKNVLIWLDSFKNNFIPTNKKYAYEVLPEERIYHGNFRSNN